MTENLSDAAKLLEMATELGKLEPALRNAKIEQDPQSKVVTLDKEDGGYEVLRISELELVARRLERAREAANQVG